MSEPDWGDFKLLLALSRGGSVAGAARVLGLDSSTISRRLAALEHVVGACLVLRGGREFSFTAEGRTAVAAAETIETIVTTATTTIRAAKTGVEGVIRISSVPSLVRFLIPLQSIVAEKHPRLSIDLNAAIRTVDLAKGEADIAIRMARPTEIDLVARRAFEWGGGVYASKGYVAKHGLPKSCEELSQHRLVQYVESMLHLPWFGWIEAFANKNAPSTRVDGTEMALSVVESGGGIGVLSCFTGDSSPNLVRVFPEPIAYVTGWIVYHETARNSARIHVAVDMLAEFLEAQGDLLSGRVK